MEILFNALDALITSLWMALIYVVLVSSDKDDFHIQ
jgi:hypothetical protein